MPDSVPRSDGQDSIASHKLDELLARIAFLESEVRALERTVSAFETHPLIQLAIRLQNRAARMLRNLGLVPRPNPAPELLAFSRPSADVAVSLPAWVEPYRLPGGGPMAGAAGLSVDPVAAGHTPYLLLLPPGYEADALALSRLIGALSKTMADRPDLIYFDEELDDQLLLRPAWSPSLLDDDRYPGPILVSRASLLALEPIQRTESLRDTGKVAGALDASGIRPRHWPRPVVRRSKAGLQMSVDRSGASIRRDSSGPPARSCTVIVCSRTPELVGRFLGSLERTAGPCISQILLVAHQPFGQLRPFAPGHPRLTQIDFQGPFNFSRMNNLAARQAAGEVLLFLNDDVFASRPGWVEALLANLAVPCVGAVGALLRYPDGQIQHAGVTISRGAGAGHAGRFSLDAPSYWPWLTETHEVLAVTGACLAIHRELFFEVGSFDESLPVNYNDVDLCLRVRRQGKDIVCVAADGLVHAESQTRRAGVALEERCRFFQKWPGLAAEVDPFHHPWLAPGEIMALRDPADWLAAGLDSPRLR